MDCIHWAFAVHFLITYNWLYITLNINGKDALYFSSNYLFIDKSIKLLSFCCINSYAVSTLCKNLISL